MSIIRFFITSLVILLSFGANAYAQDKPNCAGTDTACILALLETKAASISEDSWRDSTYREVAKLMTAQGNTEQALALIPRIKNPDTKAMTIRGIGMEAAKLKLSPNAYTSLWGKLRVEADKIEHPPSYAIALTYIAMAQAFAADDAGAMKTAAAMENAALRNKAYAETAEIQAARGDIKAVTASIAAINDAAFRDKAYMTVAKLFADRKFYNQAFTSAVSIENNFQESQALLYILAKQITPEEVSLQ